MKMNIKKVWELSMDLARFLYNLNFFPLNVQKDKFTDVDAYLSLNFVKNFFLENYSNCVLNFVRGSQQEDNLDLKILELGCGHGLPSLSVIKLMEDLVKTQIATLVGIDESNEKKIDKIFNLNIIVYMQDFNKQILEGITFENSKKLLEQSLNKICFKHDNICYKLNFNRVFKFVYGDWRDILENSLLPSHYFNLILTSETIYNSQNYKSLIDLFKGCLCRETNSSIKGSMVVLSAKTYYFGCGGNLYEFLNLIKSDYCELDFSKNLLFDAIINYKNLGVKTTSQNSIENHAPTNSNNSDNQVYSLNQFENESELYSSNISKEIIKICFKN
jgi:hypothetical protein